MNDKDQKLLSNKAGIDKNANHYLIPYVDSGLPIVTTQGEGSSKPISRVLYPSQTGRTMTIYLALPLPEGSSDQPREQAGRPFVPLFGLAPDGVYPAG